LGRGGLPQRVTAGGKRTLIALPTFEEASASPSLTLLAAEATGDPGFNRDGLKAM
jgi:hypothetical protein